MYRSPNRHDVSDPHQRHPAHGSLSMSIFLGAVGWLALGSGGLLWAIAFTNDTASLTLAMLVWGIAFVVPSIIAAFAAYRRDVPTPVARHASPPRRAPMRTRSRNLSA